MKIRNMRPGIISTRWVIAHKGRVKHVCKMMTDSSESRPGCYEMLCGRIYTEVDLRGKDMRILQQPVGVHAACVTCETHGVS
jgi:hypothetical protein